LRRIRLRLKPALEAVDPVKQRLLGACSRGFRFPLEQFEVRKLLRIGGTDVGNDRAASFVDPLVYVGRCDRRNKKRQKESPARDISDASLPSTRQLRSNYQSRPREFARSPPMMLPAVAFGKRKHDAASYVRGCSAVCCVIPPPLFAACIRHDFVDLLTAQPRSHFHLIRAIFLRMVLCQHVRRCPACLTA
jgi:hypothetical protein